MVSRILCALTVAFLLLGVLAPLVVYQALGINLGHERTFLEFFTNDGAWEPASAMWIVGRLLKEKAGLSVPHGANDAVVILALCALVMILGTAKRAGLASFCTFLAGGIYYYDVSIMQARIDGKVSIALQDMALNWTPWAAHWRYVPLIGAGICIILYEAAVGAERKRAEGQ